MIRLREADRASASFKVPAAVARYGSIIFKERPVHDGDLFSRRHPKMNRLNRAKLFAPFAALVGFEEAVRSKEVQYVPKHILDTDEAYELNAVLNFLYYATRNGDQARRNHVAVRVRYFMACADVNNDAYGSLGLYHTETGTVWKVDPVSQIMQVGNKRIPIADISNITTPSGERFPIPRQNDHA